MEREWRQRSHSQSTVEEGQEKNQERLVLRKPEEGRASRRHGTRVPEDDIEEILEAVPKSSQKSNSPIAEPDANRQ